MKTWRLKKGADIRLRSAHPWVFSNELIESPKGISPGELIEVQDIKGNFLARGYGNPYSLIAFRALSFDSHVENPFSIEQITNKLFKAWKNRSLLGFKKSFRICFSEADFLPGLIIDRYVTTVGGKAYQILSYQILTYGMANIFSQADKIFQTLCERVHSEGFSSIGWTQTLLLSKNDVNIRKLEGLEVEEPQIMRMLTDTAMMNTQTNSSDAAVKNNVVPSAGPVVDLEQLHIEIPSVMDAEASVFFHVNLIEGQKTGFFLDQTHNMRLVLTALRPRLKNLKSDDPIKIIDLCCYMGQWSVQLAHFLKANNKTAEITLVDVSELALKMARTNLEAFDNIKIIVKKADVLEGLIDLAESSYDVVISDPPAFVKNKKDLEKGLHGYMKLNQQAFRIARSGAIVASCTCSGLVQNVDFKNSLRKAILRSGKKAKVIAEGGLGWDHPQLLQFPEGQYLKMLLQVVE